MTIQLFTTLGCHLCEQALELVQQLQAGGLALEVELVEIADSETLMEQYGIRIPVIKLNEAEIGWPFSVDELAQFLTNEQG